MIRYIISLCLLLFIQACDHSVDDDLCEVSSPNSNSNQSFFADVDQKISLTPEYNPIALSCHNCYDNSSLRAADTINKISEFMNQTVDLIELDVIKKEGVVNPFIVGHGGDASGVSYKGVLLEDIVSNELIVNAHQILFLEIKGSIRSKDEVRNMLNLLKQHRNTFGDFAYFNRGRFTVFRNANNSKTLDLIRDVLTESEFSDIQPFVKLSRLFLDQSSKSAYELIDKTYQCGFHMVEFDVNRELNSLALLSTYAKSRGLGVNLFTLDEGNYESILFKLKNNIDMVTVESNRQKESSIIMRIKKIIMGS